MTRLRPPLLSTITLVLVLSLSLPWAGSTMKGKAEKPTQPVEIHVFIERVVDGDTLKLANGERVRLIGVDTPETKHPRKPVQCFGKEAYRFTKKMVERMKVKLEFDWQRRDKYGRLLAYVFLDDGTFLNAEIVKQGYGFAYTRYPFKYMEEFRQYEREARNGSKGLWKECQ